MVYALRLRHQCGQRRRRFVCAASALIETADISDLRYPIWPRARRKATALAGAKHTSLQFPLQALMLPTVTAAGIPACIGAVPRAGHHSNASGVSAWLESKLRRCPRVAAPSPRGSTWPGHRGRRARRASAAPRRSIPCRDAPYWLTTAGNAPGAFGADIVAALGGLAEMIDYRLQVGARLVNGQPTSPKQLTTWPASSLEPAGRSSKSSSPRSSVLIKQR